MSYVTSNDIDPICGYCGRPVLGGWLVTGKSGVYHPECTHGPTESPRGTVTFVDQCCVGCGQVVTGHSVMLDGVGPYHPDCLPWNKP